MTLPAGTRLGPYELAGSLGAGGMGEVYRALDPKLDRLVAIKVLPPSLVAKAELLSRFEREARAVAALNHPNVPGIHDFLPLSKNVDGRDRPGHDEFLLFLSLIEASALGRIREVRRPR